MKKSTIKDDKENPRTLVKACLKGPFKVLIIKMNTLQCTGAHFQSTYGF